MRKYLFGFLIILFNVSVFADGCTHPTTSYDKTYCLAKLFLAADDELNQTYNDLRSIVSAPIKKQLLNVQRQWIAYRNKACSDQGFINVSCNMDVNKARLTYLQDRLRECKTGHCQNELIIANNFS